MNNMKARVNSTGETIYDIDEKQFDYGRYQVHGRTIDGKSVFYDSNEVTVLPREIQDSNSIDWEERRYEVAKECLLCIIDRYGYMEKKDIRRNVDDAFEFADAFINKIKE